VVHQTWKNRASLTVEMQSAMASWAAHGFPTDFTDDRGCLEDVKRLAEAMGDMRYLTVYTRGMQDATGAVHAGPTAGGSRDATPLTMTAIQRSDYWRYAKIWLDGGIYSDVDAGVTHEFAKFVSHPEVSDKVCLVCLRLAIRYVLCV
jgi:hypothetical protein